MRGQSHPFFGTLNGSAAGGRLWERTVLVGGREVQLELHTDDLAGVPDTAIAVDASGAVEAVDLES